MNNPLLFFSNNDIPFISAKLIIHNPSINELALVGEQSYRVAYQMIVNIPKELKKQVNIDSTDKDEFNIFIEMVNRKDIASVGYKNHLLSFLSLILPSYIIRIRDNDIQLIGNNENDKELHFIDSSNFQEFQEIIYLMFSSGDKQNEVTKYNPADKMAEKIADKLKNRKKKSSDTVKEIEDISVYKRYASILSIGMGLNLIDILNYTVCQLETQFERYKLFMQWDINVRMRCAGASGLDEPEDWMQEL